jgi:hypothetical protein
MDSRDPLPRRHPGSYETLMIASRRVSRPEALNDPDGNTIELVPPGRDDVTQLEVRLGVSDVNRFDTFYTKAAEATGIGDHRYKIGETIFATFRHPLAREVKPAPMANLLEVVKAMAALGIRYVTILAAMGPSSSAGRDRCRSRRKISCRQDSRHRVSHSGCQAATRSHRRTVCCLDSQSRSWCNASAYPVEATAGALLSGRMSANWQTGPLATHRGNYRRDHGDHRDYQRDF